MLPQWHLYLNGNFTLMATLPQWQLYLNGNFTAMATLPQCHLCLDYLSSERQTRK
jgi:hypothetical protein